MFVNKLDKHRFLGMKIYKIKIDGLFQLLKDILMYKNFKSEYILNKVYYFEIVFLLSKYFYIKLI